MYVCVCIYIYVYIYIYISDERKQLFRKKYMTAFEYPRFYICDTIQPADTAEVHHTFRTPFVFMYPEVTHPISGVNRIDHNHQRWTIDIY